MTLHIQSNFYTLKETPKRKKIKKNKRRIKNK